MDNKLQRAVPETTDHLTRTQQMSGRRLLSSDDFSVMKGFDDDKQTLRSVCMFTNTFTLESAAALLLQTLNQITYLNVLSSLLYIQAL